MLRLTYSNRTEMLVAAMARRLPRDPFVETTVVVPNRAMERVVETGLARTLGMVANLRFERLESWLTRELEARAAEAGTPRRHLRLDELEGRILSVLSDPALASDPELAEVTRYLVASGAGDEGWGSGAVERRRLELAPRMAQLFQEYVFSRPEWIRAWMAGAPLPAVPTGESWQRALYRRTRALVPSTASEVPRTTLAEELERDEVWQGSGRVLVFGVSYVARTFQLALVRLGRTSEVELFALNPCREFWADVETAGEARARARRARGGENDPYGLLVTNESSLLRAWGRPGREHVALLDEASGFDAEEHFVEPVERWRARRGPHDPSGRAPLLLRLQAAILERSIVERSIVEQRVAGQEVAEGTAARDGSVVLLPCSSVRREVESVAQMVWGLVAEGERVGEPLSLPDIAVLVQAGDRERYLPHLEAVFGEARSEEPHHLPWSAQDLQLASRSRVAEAALRLLSFFGASPTRRELLGLAAHPLVRVGASSEEGTEQDPLVWAELAERVGIVRGIDESDLADTYADRASGEGQVLHFDQGLRRLALGCAVGDRELGDRELAGPEPAERDAEPLGLAPARIGARVAETLGLLTLSRSLLADHRAVARARLRPSSWARLFERLLDAYLSPSSRAEESELDRCRAALRGLSALEVDERRYGAEVALALAVRALEAVPAVRGEPQAVGLVVASLLPMRAIPFRVVFVLGLGEGQFPQQRTDVGLDLRAAHRRAGDVAPDERDRYAFLETLLSTRERLILSYIARDEHTGDPIGPSSVVQELVEACGSLTTCAPPHRRHESVDFAWLAGAGLDHPRTRAAMARALPAALAERAVRARGDAERSHFEGFEIRSEAWAVLAADDPRRVELSVPMLVSTPVLQSSGPPAERQEPQRVALDVLDRFLRCPIQGRAAHWLRSTEEDEEALLVAEEPLDASDRIGGRLARAAFARALEAGLGEEPRAALARGLARELLEARGRGQLPIGLLGHEAARGISRSAEAWLAALLEARPSARHARAVRFGSVSLDRARSEARVEALGAIACASAAGPISIEGRTQPFLRDGDALRSSEGHARGHGAQDDGAHDDGAQASVAEPSRGHPSVRSRRGDLVVLAPGPGGQGDRARVPRLRAALEAYLDHVALAAAGQDRVARRVVLLSSEGAYEARLAPVTREAAARWLGALADDLLRAPPAFVPVEAILLEEDAMRRGDPRLAEKLARAVEVVRTKWEGGSSRHGPIRDAVKREAPEPRELLKLVARRFAPFFQHVLSPVRVGSAGASEGLLR